MIRVVAPVLLLCVAGCSDRPKLWSESEIQDIAGDAASDATADALADTDHEARIEDLESKVDALERRLGIVSDLAISTSDAHDSLTKTFNSNVEKLNAKDQAERQRRTQRGECGYETQAAGNGGVIYVPRAC
jgi:hypothetical protein